MGDKNHYRLNFLKSAFYFIFIIIIVISFSFLQAYAISKTSDTNINKTNNLKPGADDTAVKESDKEDAEDDDEDEAKTDDAQKSTNELSDKQKALLNRSDLEAKLVEIYQGKEVTIRTMFYNNLEELLDYVLARAINRKSTPEIELTRNFELKKQVRTVFMLGLKNTDPRVRLSCAIILRRIGVHPDMQKNIRMALYVETIQASDYIVKTIEGKEYKGRVADELYKLDRLITRQIMNERLRSGSLTVEDFKIMSGELLLPLLENMEDEPVDSTPLKTLQDREIDFLFAGLFNKDYNVQDKCAIRLAQIYWKADTLGIIKSQIESKAQSFMVLKNAIDNNKPKPEEPKEEKKDDDDDEKDD